MTARRRSKREGTGPGLVVTCEHASRHVPADCRGLFAGHEALLRSHRGWDPGSLAAARTLAREAGAPLFAGTVSRLVVDLNRSEHHPRLFSEVTRALPRARREALLDGWYRPFRAEVEDVVRRASANGRRVVHISVHSFAPSLGGKVRHADVGLLYDPSRERAFADELAAALGEALPDLRVRRNYPYRGVADGHTTALRRAFPKRRYQGIELELSQGLTETLKRRIGRVVARSSRRSHDRQSQK